MVFSVGTLPDRNQKNALIGNPASPSSTNRYVTEGGSAVWTKFTVSHTAFQTGALTNSITLFTTAANAIFHGFKVKHSTAFAGTSISAYSVSIGVVGNTTKYTTPFDVLQATGSNTFQLTNTLAAEDQAGGTAIKITATSVGANLSASTQGSVDVWVLLSFAA